ncbi:Alpha/beta hydrolase fold-1,Alpha/Beta hydrolase fold,AB hydrolase 4 family [Cinara cedri]|uniref:Alpha/beta hydrolase fold-1,Alpha/Beta hydrolase fold,AB hydrolase 4 family n=1 Tax=Cinara cedri TaxID=506608 RepID=A0A5E4MBZ2_9HEMI|nr:Alpha/beta hydrolase fold-1,Alpha/Beta hydrolase fold,AB hydrolase 4 family [Cinara cedri]
MSVAVLTAIAVFLIIVFRMLNVSSQPQKPLFFCKDKQFLNRILKYAPQLEDPYVPTRLWGFSGHVQTILYSVFGRVRCPCPKGDRRFLMLEDGTTLTYDLFKPTYIEPGLEDITVVIVPGICNSSESDYIRTFVNYTQNQGYRCAVLNHVGALHNVPVTASRIFTYGHTDDLHVMLCNLSEHNPNNKIIIIGYSMGGNLVTKYLGEPRQNRPNSIIAGISICQPYDALKATGVLLHWQNFRRLYLYALTEAIKALILKHRSKLLAEDIKEQYSLNEKDIISAATLPELDDAYTRKVNNFKNLHEFYQWSSCLYYINNVKTPMIFINSRDDPLVPEDLLIPIQNFAKSKDNILYMELMHGGHLGFFEGGFMYPNPIAWLDRTLVSLLPGLNEHCVNNVKRTAVF